MPAREQTLSWWARLSRWAHSRRVVVQDRSMLPSLAPGDRLRVDTRAFLRSAAEKGDLVVAVDPEAPSRWIVKRVGALPASTSGAGTQDRIWLSSDNPTEGRDSRRFGEVSAAALVGKVYFRYGPARRRGNLERSKTP